MKTFITLTLQIIFLQLCQSDSVHPAELWDHLSSAESLTEQRGVVARFEHSGHQRVLHLSVTERSLAVGETSVNKRQAVAWTSLPPPPDGWNLNCFQNIEATIHNTGTDTVHVTVWVVSSHGWSAVGATTALERCQQETVSCDLRELYPDGTPKIDPGQVKEIRIMIQQCDSASIHISKLVATGPIGAWVRPKGHLDVPEMTEGDPQAGRRVRYSRDSLTDQEIYCTLYLPSNWESGKKYPVIAEYPGNLFFNSKKCWSTGRPEQCVMGYGITKGVQAIWVSLPFVSHGKIAESGFGSHEGKDTADFTIDILNDICTCWGGDKRNIFLCGFSRGAIACGYIGLRDDKIARLWKGFVACQHYDGSNWRESNMHDAIQRAPRFHGKAIFQIDNSAEKYAFVVDATDPSVQWTWATSGLGYHATAMFLDKRPLMMQLQQWFQTVAMPSH